MFGLDSKRLKEKGITLIEALISTVIVGIGFAAVFQMVNYSVQSVDVSGERTKANYLISMVAEDVIGDKLSKAKDGSKFHDYLVTQRDSNFNSWKMGTCGSGASGSGSFSNAQQNKFRKWDNRFSRKRLKCKGANSIKFLKIYDICKNGCRYTNGTQEFILVNGTEKIVIGKMEANIPTSGITIDAAGDEVPKVKKKYLYFQIH